MIKRVLFTSALVAALIFVPAAQGKPQRTTLSLEREFVQGVSGEGCTSATVTERLPGRPLHVWPDVGEGLRDRASVLAVEVDGRKVVWTVGPDEETCAARPGDDWSWYSGETSWGAAYRDRLYVVAATRRNGVRSVAGFRTRWRGRQGPSIRRTKRALGRPTSIQGSRWGRSACYVRWAHLGLRVTFSNFGGSPACKAGWFQTARIVGSRARQWAVVVDGRKDRPVPVGTSLRYLREEGLASYNYLNEAWALSEDWLPYGEAGYYSTVTARLAGDNPWDGGNPVRGFDLYIGAAGD